MADVKFVHPEYTAALPYWMLTIDAASDYGVEKKADEYLAAGEAKKNAANYPEFKQRAIFLGVTGRTRSTLVGAANNKPAKFDGDLPPQLEYFTNDFDGQGIGIDQFALRLVFDILTTGRRGSIVEYPVVGSDLSKEQEDAIGAHPYSRAYNALSIINWNETIDGVDMVVVKEQEYKPVNGSRFEKELVDSYKSFTLVNNVYTVEDWDESGKLVGEPIKPMIRREVQSNVPFYFTGSEDNKSCIDSIPLYSIAKTNIGLFRNSASYEENLYNYASATLIVMSSMSDEDFKNANPGGLIVGAGNGVKLEQGDSAELLQVEAATGVSEAMKQKIVDMVAIGASMITQSGSNETAEAARIAASGEKSVVLTIIDNCEDTINAMIEQHAKYYGIENPPKYVMNRLLFDSTLSAQDIMAINVLYDAGHIAKSDVRSNLKTSGILDADRSDKDIDSENANNTIL